MARNLWSVLCERITVDQRTNLISYLTCIEGVTTLQLPGTVPTLAIGTAWLREGDNDKAFVFRLVVVNPDNSEKVLMEGSQEFASGQRARLGFVMDGFPIQQTGQYVFRIETKSDGNWEVRATLPMDVGLQTPAEQTRDSKASATVSDVAKPKANKKRGGRTKSEKETGKG